jgi:hypothetical protein
MVFHGIYFYNIDDLHNIIYSGDLVSFKKKIKFNVELFL